MELFTLEQLEHSHSLATAMRLVGTMTLYEYIQEYFVQVYDEELNFIGWDSK